MREIEIKAHVRDWAAFVAALERMGVELGAAVEQRDEVFGLPEVVEGRRTGNRAVTDATAPWLRVRIEYSDDTQPVVYVTFKQSQGAHLDKLEYELTVDSADAATEMIRALGFVPYSDVTKRRRQGRIDDTTTVCVDEVKGLGLFVELERLVSDDTPYEEIAGELWAVLERLGVDQADEVTRGYDVLLFEQSTMVY